MSIRDVDHRRRGALRAFGGHRRQAPRLGLPGRSSRACWSTRSSAFRRRWCSSPRRSCSRSAACRSSRRTTSRRVPKRFSYYRKVVDTYDLQIAFEEKVLAVEPGEKDGRAGRVVFAGDGTRLRGRNTVEAGVRRVRHARNVVFAIGYFDHPICSACRVRICRTCIITTASRTVTIASAS